MIEAIAWKEDRRMVRLIGITSLMAALTLALSGEGNAVTPEPKTVTVTEKENGTKIKLAKGDSLVLKLVEQPGTAFGWDFIKSGEKVLKLQGKPLTEKPEKPIPGGKVTKVWRFKAEGAGVAELEMHYRRPFDDPKKTPPAKTFKLTVQVD